MKEIPRKNYIFLIIIFVLTILTAFYIRKWYITSKDYYDNNSVIKEITQEINQNELGSITVENQKFILYVSSGINKDIKQFEKELKTVIRQLDISKDTIYINKDNTDIESFNTELKNQFAINNNIARQIENNSECTIYIFEDGKIISVLNNVNNFPMKQLTEYLKKWGFNND